MLPRELQVVRDLDDRYRREVGESPEHSENLVYYLGDNASWSATWSAKSQKIPTYRRSSGLFYHRQTGKFLTGQDKLASLGWPVTQQVAENMLTKCMPSLDPARSHFLAGNAMHLSNVTMVLLLGLSVFKPKA